jgi:hypothetical protein
MQGHPESPRLWEKHADAILPKLGLTLIIREPCLYSGIINNNRVLLKRQVDNFAIAAPDAKTADVLLDLIDDKLKIPVKRQGYLDMYNGIDVLQTRHYIKISVTSFINKVFEKHLTTWMKSAYPSPARSTPLPSDANWLKKFNAATGDPDPKQQTLSVPWIPWWHGKRSKEKSEYLAYSIYVSTVTPPHNSLCIDKETCEL